MDEARDRDVYVVLTPEEILNCFDVPEANLKLAEVYDEEQGEAGSTRALRDVGLYKLIQ